MGRLPDNPATRERYGRDRNYGDRRMVTLDESTIIQPCGYVMDQKDLPSCVGKSFQGRLNGLLAIDVSGVGLWTECRSYDGSLADASQGTTAESAIEILLLNGWLQRIDVNEDDTDPEDPSLLQLPGLDQVLEADDRRIAKAVDHEVIVGTDDAIHAAILQTLRENDEQGQPRNALVFGTGVFASYFNPPGDTVLDETYLSPNGSQGGHEQGLMGWYQPRNAYVIRGSWGPDWTYCQLPIGVGGAMVILRGSCLVSRGVVEHAWDIDKVRVR